MPAESIPTDLLAAFLELCRAAAAADPTARVDVQAGAVRLTFNAGHGIAPAAGTTARPVTFTEIEQDILDALREQRPGESFTAEEISKLAGWENNGRFRETLARFVRTALLNRPPGRNGYILSDACREPAVAAAPPQAPANDGLTEMERDIVQAVTEGAGGEPMTAEQVATKAGYDCTGRFKETLAGLVRRGQLARATGRSGYLPPTGQP